MGRSKLAGWTTKQKTSLEDDDTFLEVLASHGRIVVDLLALELYPSRIAGLSMILAYRHFLIKDLKPRYRPPSTPMPMPGA